MKNTKQMLTKWQLDRVNELKRGMADNPARIIPTEKKLRQAVAAG